MKLSEFERKELLKYIGLYNFDSFLANKTILITGSKGIIGSGVIKWVLLENELHNLNIKIIASTRNIKDIPTYIEEYDNIQFCTFGREEEECKNIAVDYIIHAASPTSNKIFISNPVESLNVILDGTRRMLELASKKEAGMIYISSEEAYGTPREDVPITENYVGSIDSLSIRSCYPLGKKVAELYCKSYCEEYGLDVKIIRPTVILGLWQDYESVKIESEIMRCIIEQKNLILKTDGSTKKSVIYSLDAVSAIFTVLFKGTKGEAYNATNPATFMSVKENAENLFKTFNNKVRIEFDIEENKNTGYLPTRIMNQDITKISKLGWKPIADMNYIVKIDILRFRENAK